MPGGYRNNYTLPWEHRRRRYHIAGALLGDLPSGPVAKTLFPMQGAQVRSLVEVLNPACHNSRSHVLQLRPGAVK